MKVKLSNLILVLIYLHIPVDTLNGIVVRKLDFSVSPIYKILILILIFFYLTKRNKLAPILWSAFFFSIFAFHIMLGSFSEIEIFWGFKFLAIVFSFYFFSQMPDRVKLVTRFATISFWIIGINIIIGMLGFGYAQYARNDIGTRGLFYAGNELGILLLVTSIILLSNYLIHKDIKKYLLFSFIFMLLAAMLTTKTALLGQIIVISGLPVIDLLVTRKGFKLKKNSLKLVSFGIIALLLGLPALGYYVLYEMNLIARLSYWADKVDPITLFFSGRNLLANDIFEYIRSHGNIFNNIVGYGYDTLITVTGRSVEIDLIDLIMIFGLLGALAMYGFLFTQVFWGLRIKPTDNAFRPFVTFGIVLLLLLSCLSGHVLNSGMAGILIGAFLSLQYYVPNKKVA